jgi:hypothetical protein
MANCEILGKLREVKALADDIHFNGGGTRELSLTITKIDEAILWRQRDMQLRNPADNSAKQQDA